MRLRYAYQDLGEQPAGATVQVKLRGSGANVILLDQPNFLRYGVGQRFTYTGGHYARSRVELPIPRDGHWYLVVDVGGHHGRVQGSVEVLLPDGSHGRQERIEAGAHRTRRTG